MVHHVLKSRNPLSLDMGWKGRRSKCKSIRRTSQSAFAGYGLEGDLMTAVALFVDVAIRFRWIWVGSKVITHYEARNL